MKTKISSILIVLLVLVSFSNVFAQPDPGKVIENMKIFSWMAGDWVGDAWYMGRDQKKSELKQKEHVTSRLDGTIITMEGTGYNEASDAAEAKIVFQAFGILSYDQNNSRYVIRAYKSGNFLDSDVVFNEDGSYSWRMDLPNGKIRYTFRQTEDGKWNEVGEFTYDNGQNWYQTFEMNLTKQ